MKFEKGNCHNPYGRPKGIPMKQEWKDRMSKVKTGMKYKPMSEIGKQNLSKAHMGQKGYWTGKKRLHMTGEKHFAWKGGISKDDRHYLRIRRNRKYNADGSHTFGEWELLKKQYGFICPYCKRQEPEIKLTEDHIIPLSKGGSDYIENIQPLCKSCNCKKYNKIIDWPSNDQNNFLETYK